VVQTATAGPGRFEGRGSGTGRGMSNAVSLSERTGSGKDFLHGLQAKVRSTERLYANGAERPMQGYLALASVYGVSVCAAAMVLRRRGVRVPERIAWGDLALITVATHKASRLLAKDSVTALVRAPFTSYQEPAGEGEVNEKVNGHGLRHAVGELLTCPFCLSVWIATGLAMGFVASPRHVRLVASVLCAVTGSDCMQFAYAGLQRSA
jgi:hypothetical protein